jgi:hypothetical protein
VIVPRACDLCLRGLPTELVQFEFVRGSLASTSALQWTIQPVTAGTRLTTICRPCSEYLQAAVARLREHHARERAEQADRKQAQAS